MNRLRHGLLGLVLAVLPAVSAAAGFEAEGWYTGGDAERAVEAAQERGLPVAVILTAWEST